MNIQHIIKIAYTGGFDLPTLVAEACSRLLQANQHGFSKHYAVCLVRLFQIRAYLRLDVTGHPRSVEYPMESRGGEMAIALEDIQKFLTRPDYEPLNRVWDKVFCRVLFHCPYRDTEVLRAVHTLFLTEDNICLFQN